MGLEGMRVMTEMGNKPSAEDDKRVDVMEEERLAKN